ncbi:Cytochrome P450 [Streptomyces zhaozhouensis]|uniref:Cytochrome P450 n=1 Tax=Streptomyces zhaozhouensis TaxID=1300267 RepID=A0A286DY88_9ACTN|nr:cytochrome P450 [Streptomyces zhaozhouensis]SOD63628.1 Cytochrome P450 [Streptomyces zhaozhouensis]
MTCPVHHAADSPGADTIVLDPLVRDLAGEGEALLAAGPIARVELPGGVTALAVTRHEEARRLLNDPRLVKDVNAWGAWQRGEISEEWPLIGLAAPPRSMLTVDGPEHRRLRAKVAQALTPRRVHLLRPGVERVTERLLADLAAQPVGEPVDLKAHFSYPLPMAVICELMGIDPADQPELRSLFDEFFNTQTPPARVPKMLAELRALFEKTVEAKRAHPGDDLTSALILADDGGERLTDDEITNTLQLAIAAGHETTVALLNNAVRGLLAHPDQKALVLDGEVPWENVIEETLRYSSPTSHVLIRFATEDIEVGDTVIPKGEGLVTSYVAIGWDEKQHGPTARQFDITRPTPIRHISFGHGPHVCPGAPLSRLEAAIALPALFERFPDLAPAVPDEALTRRPNVTQNDLAELPVLLHGAPGR